MKQYDNTWMLWLIVPFTTFVGIWLLTRSLYHASGGFAGTLVVSIYQAVRLRKKSYDLARGQSGSERK
jgi:hypothetical protein